HRYVPHPVPRKEVMYVVPSSSLTRGNGRRFLAVVRVAAAWLFAGAWLAFEVDHVGVGVIALAGSVTAAAVARWIAPAVTATTTSRQTVRSVLRGTSLEGHRPLLTI